MDVKHHVYAEIQELALLTVKGTTEKEARPEWTIHLIEDTPLVEFMYLVFTRMPGVSNRRRLGSLLLYLSNANELPSVLILGREGGDVGSGNWKRDWAQ